MAAQSENPVTGQAPKRPRHIAVIMDGNGRWAQLRSKPRHTGHRAGVEAVKTVVEAATQSGIDYLTLFAFSSENWGRPGDEVSRLMGLFFDVLQREIDELHRNGVRLTFVGQLDLLSARLRRRMRDAEKLTSANTALRLQIAVAYGGRWDITNALRTVAARVEAGDLSARELDEETIAQNLALGSIPDPDLLIRTGGEHRISNFLLWNLAYTELYFCGRLWPDFGEDDFAAALEFFADRKRRFGKTDKQVGVA